MKSKNLAPIALFTYNRINHLKLTINNLKKNYLAKSSHLYIFSDGFKTSGEIEKINKIRFYLKKVKGFKKINIIERKKNFGLSKNIIKGVNYVLRKHKKIIVVEDDILVNKNFLNYMNTGLAVYEKNKNVASIHGYIYPIQNLKNKIKKNTFFLKGSDCWGWATWSRAWLTFEKNGSKLSKNIKKQNKVKEFNFNNYYNYYQMLINQVKGKNDSWAVRWYASCFLKGMYTLYPCKTLVKNIGIDKFGQNTKIDLLGLANTKIDTSKYDVKKQEIKESEVGRLLVEKFFQNKKIFRIKSFIRNFLDV